jgi:serine/threonine protein kinase
LDRIASVLGRELNDNEQNILVTMFPQQMNAWNLERLPSKRAAERLVGLIHATIKTITTKVLIQNGYLLDRLLEKSGTGKALLYHVVELNTLHMKCAKVYSLDTFEGEALREQQTNDAIHKNGVCTTIVHYEKVLSATHQWFNGKRGIYIMPLLAISLEDFLSAYQSRVDDRMLLRTMLSLLHAGKRFHEENLSHCDIKPANIMLDSDGYFILIDLGAAVQIGESAFEYTEGYFLDAAAHAIDYKFDLYCIATTITRCLIPEFSVQRSMSAQTLQHYLDTRLDVTIKLGLDYCFTSDNCIEAYAKTLEWAKQINLAEVELFMQWTKDTTAFF